MYTFSFKTSSPIIARTIYIPSNAQRSWNRVLLINIPLFFFSDFIFKICVIAEIYVIL